MKLITAIVHLSARAHPPGRRLLAIGLESAVFVVFVPGLLVLSVPGPAHAAFSHSAPGSLALGAGLALAGLGFAGWSVWTQYARGKGTPVPVMATQHLLREGPYALCRNPMACGTILYYAGVALALWHPVPLLWVAAIATALILMIKLVEEKEVARRFGAAYAAYKADTPFMIPRLRRR